MGSKVFTHAGGSSTPPCGMAVEAERAVEEDHRLTSRTQPGNTSPHDTDEPQEGGAGKRHKVEDRRMRVRRCGSVRSDCRLSAERGNSQHRHHHQQQYPKMIPAIAADRRLRQKVAAKRGARTVTSIDLLTLPLHVGELSRVAARAI